MRKTPDAGSNQQFYGNIFLAAALSAGAFIVGCETDQTRVSVAKVVSGQGAAGTPEGTTDRWKQYEKIGKELEQLGAEVRWNHPEEGPTDPIFIVESDHVLMYDEGVRSEQQALGNLCEYRVKMHLAKSGCRRFSAEGGPSSTHYHAQAALVKDDANETMRIYEMLPPSKKAAIEGWLSPAQTASIFANDDTALNFIRGCKNLGNISLGMFAASVSDDRVSITGSEDPLRGLMR